MSTTFENVYQLPDIQINDYLTKANVALTTPLQNKLAVTILLYNNNFLQPGDKRIIDLAQAKGIDFNALYLMSDEQLVQLSQGRFAIKPEFNRLDLIRNLILSAPGGHGGNGGNGQLQTQQQAQSQVQNWGSQQPQVQPQIQAPTRATSQGLGIEVKQEGDRYIVCGKKTYFYRDRLKALKGFWDRGIKCWTFPLSKRNDIEEFLLEISNEASTNLTQFQGLSGGANGASGRGVGASSSQQYQQQGLYPTSQPQQQGLYPTSQPPQQGLYPTSQQQSLYPTSQLQQQGLYTTSQPPQQHYPVTQQQHYNQQQRYGAPLQPYSNPQDNPNLSDWCKQRMANTQAQCQLLTQTPDSSQNSSQTVVPQSLGQGSLISQADPFFAPQIPQADPFFAPHPQIPQEADITPYLIPESPIGYDIPRLQHDWQNKIKIVRRLPADKGSKIALMTYDGPIKPPNEAFAHSLCNWGTNHGYTIEDESPRVYKVSTFA